MRPIECLACERVTQHDQGPVQSIADGAAVVVWWTCTVCATHTLP